MRNDLTILLLVHDTQRFPLPQLGSFRRREASESRYRLELRPLQVSNKSSSLYIRLTITAALALVFSNSLSFDRSIDAGFPVRT